MHHVVSDQQSGESLIEMIQHVKRLLRALVTVVRIGNHAYFADRRKSGLGRGEIRASQKQQRYEKQISRNNGNTSGVHKDESPPVFKLRVL